MSFPSSTSLAFDKTVHERDLSDVCIEKPRTLSETCPVETTTKRLPLIEERPWRKKESKNTQRAPEPEVHCLRSAINLPKLPLAEEPHIIRSRRQEPSELSQFLGFNSTTLKKHADSNADKYHNHVVSMSLNCYKDLQGVETDESSAVCPDAVGPSASEFLFRVPSSELNFDEFKVEEEKLSESHELQRWEYWLKEHRTVQEHLSKRLNQKKCDLLFQKAQNYRMRVEDKSLFFLTQIPAADKWRGHPFFWRSPHKIGGPDNSLLTEDSATPQYYGVKTKLDEGEVPDMEFIGVPTAVKREKDLLCDCDHSNKASELKWERLQYRQLRLWDFRKETRNLKPHNIQMDGLEIVGTKIPQQQPVEVIAPAKVDNLPQIKVTSAQCEDSCRRELYDDRSSVFCLSIGGKELEYDVGNEYCQKPKKTIADLNWEIDFGVNPVGALVERSLRVENKGTMAVEYNFFFQNLGETHMISSLQLKQHEPLFFFNKNPGIFLPGQIYYLKFYHYSKRSGVRKETWNLKTKPPLSKNGENGKVVLWAVTSGDSSDSIISSIDSYLRQRVTESTVGFILQILIRKALNPLEYLGEIEYRSLFFEKELFEYHNPKHYYHSVMVKELRRIFEQIPSKSQEQWDLSLASLIELTVANIKGKDQDYILRRVSEEAKKLLRPNRLSVRNMKNYRMTYNILCKMTNLVEEDYDHLRSCFVQKKEFCKPFPIHSESGETDDEFVDYSIKLGEKETTGECWSSDIFLGLKSADIFFFQSMFYMKVYYRVSEAIGEVVGALETSKLSEPRQKIDPKLTKPSRRGRE